MDDFVIFIGMCKGSSARRFSEWVVPILKSLWLMQITHEMRYKDMLCLTDGKMELEENSD